MIKKIVDLFSDREFQASLAIGCLLFVTLLAVLIKGVN